MADVRPAKKDEGGGAGWIMTFADLMSLLMCFFVLLLSFAELDIMKYKAIAGSLKLAFGVQREIRAIEVPKGTSIIAQEFSAGKPQPTLIDEVRQQTTDEDKQSLEFTDALTDDPAGDQATEPDGGMGPAERQAALDAAALTAALADEIAQGMIEIDAEHTTLVVRIREKGSLPSGTARFDPAFTPVLDKAHGPRPDPGHHRGCRAHDDVPISTAVYRSNWDLASARAVSVVHALLEHGELEPARFVAEGHGEAHPLAPNDTPGNRALNRRVEITIRQEPAGGSRSVPAAAADADAVAAAQFSAPHAAPPVPDWVPGAMPPAWLPGAADATPTELPTPVDETAAGAATPGPEAWTTPNSPGPAPGPAPGPEAWMSSPPAGGPASAPGPEAWTAPSPAAPLSRLERIRNGLPAGG